MVSIGELQDTQSAPTPYERNLALAKTLDTEAQHWVSERVRRLITGMDADDHVNALAQALDELQTTNSHTLAQSPQATIEPETETSTDEHIAQLTEDARSKAL
jgi:hypothetical protein